MIRGLIGVVHLAPLPGDPLATEHTTFETVRQRAWQDAQALVAGGADGMIIENFGSLPFAKGTAGEGILPHVVSGMTRVVERLVSALDLPVGVNCLRNDACAALGIAAATGADFVRVNVHTGAYATDQGIIEGEAAATLRYRRALGADAVAILADVLVKHAQPLVPISVGDATRDAVERGLADGVIITGSATGAPPDPASVRAAREAAGDRPVFVGSGVTPENAATLAPLADGVIAGTWLKERGQLRAPVDSSRVRELRQALGGLWPSGSS